MLYEYNGFIFDFVQILITDIKLFTDESLKLWL